MYVCVCAIGSSFYECQYLAVYNLHNVRKCTVHNWIRRHLEENARYRQITQIKFNQKTKLKVVQNYLHNLYFCFVLHVCFFFGCCFLTFFKCIFGCFFLFMLDILQLRQRRLGITCSDMKHSFIQAYLIFFYFL